MNLSQRDWVLGQLSVGGRQPGARAGPGQPAVSVCPVTCGVCGRTRADGW